MLRAPAAIGGVADRLHREQPGVVEEVSAGSAPRSEGALRLATLTEVTEVVDEDGPGELEAGEAG